jgi:ketosteroid isomerase-like protein
MDKIRIYFNGLFLFLVSIVTLSCQQQPKFSIEEDTKSVNKIFEIFDSGPDRKTRLSLYVEDIVFMAPGEKTITNKEDLFTENPKGQVDMHHEITWIQSYADIVIVRATNKGDFHPNDSNESFPFTTNNLIVFRRIEDGSLKIWQIIYNLVDSEQN